MLPLFAYGTLRDPDYQRELFARTYHMKRARVRDFAVTSSPTGYLVATPRLGAAVDGAIVDIDEAGYAVADAWEDLTVYDRIEVDAVREDLHVQRAYMYVARDTAGVPVTERPSAERSRADIVADIRRFRASDAFRDQR